MHRDLRWNEYTCKRHQKQEPQAVPVLNSQIKKKTSDSEQHHRKNKSRKPGKEDRPGKPREATTPGERTAGYHSAAVVPDIGPNFSSWVRKNFVHKFFHLIQNPSRTFWSLFVHHRNALDHCAAAAAWNVSSSCWHCHFTQFIVYFPSSRAHFLQSLAMLIQLLLFWILLSIDSSFSFSSWICLRKSLMSSSHLFLGLPIALLVLYLELRSGFHSAAFLNHLSLGEVAIQC